MNGRQRRKLFAGAGLITMLLGALLTLAPTGAGAELPAMLDLYGVYGSKGQGGNLNLGCSDLGVGDKNLRTGDALDDPLLDFGAQDSLGKTDGELNGITVTSVPDTDPLQVTFTAPSHVGFVIVKQATYSAVFVANPGVTEGRVYVALPPAEDDEPMPSDTAYSHIEFCEGTPPQPQYGSFTIEKDFDGDLAPTNNPSFSIEIACSNGQTPIDLNGDAAGNSTTVQVKESDNPIWSSTSLGVQLPQGATCLIEETPVPTDVESVTYKVDGVAAAVNPDGQIAVTIGSAVKAVLVTNDYGNRQPGTGDLTVSKVAGTNPPNPSPTFSFTVDCEDGDPIDLNGAETAGTQASFNLTFGQSRSFEDLPEGATCDVVETVDGNATSTTHKVNGGDNVNSKTAADVAITDGGNATVAFTNNFPGTGPGCVDNPNTPFDDCNFVPPPGCVDDAATAADECNPEPPEVITDVCPQTPGTQTMIESCVEVLPNEQERPPVVTPPVETPPQATPPAPQVEGDVVTRTLPRTGNESRDLAAFGAALLLLGAGLVLTSRSRFARVD